MLNIYLSMLETKEDKLTLAKLYEELKSICYYKAIAITKNPELAHDAVHNAFLAVIKHKDEIFALPHKKRISRIVIIAKNKAIDLMRTRDERSKGYMEEADVAADGFDLCDIIEHQEAFGYLMDCIKALPEMYKVPFELRYVQDMNNQEIADSLGITYKAVSSRIARAKLKLREMLDKDG